MKKIITFLTLFLLMSGLASALVKYEGAPSTPYLVFGHVEWNDQPFAGVRLEITNKNTGYTRTIATDSNGYWQDEATSWLTINSMRSPVQYGDVISVKVLDGCGVGDTCTKEFTAYSGDSTYYYKVAGQVDLSLTGEIDCPPCNCPGCNCGSCGGGGSCNCGGGVIYNECKEPEYTYENCKGVCPDCKCDPTLVCDSETISEICEPCDECLPCEECKECKECPEVPSGLTGGQMLIWFISILGVGGAGIFSGIQLTKDRVTSIRGVTYRVKVQRDGDVLEEHRHYGIKSYHSINTEHREEHERHKKGEKFPRYEKDELGIYNYVG